MTHISRPFQIALAAMALFAVVWFVALRGHSGGGGGTGSSASSAGVSAATPAKATSSKGAGGSGGSVSSGSVYHGPAPGVEGLTRAITKAQGAVAQSQQNAKQLQEKVAQASSSSPVQSQTQPSSAGTSAGSHASSASGARAVAPTVKAAPRSAKPTTAAARNKPVGQTLVEAELKQGRTVILLFWNPTSVVDRTVRSQLQLLQAFHQAHGLPQNRNIAVHDAGPGQVALFGSITRSVQIDQTPTMLIIAPDGKTKTLAGLADAYTIQQGISEARHS